MMVIATYRIATIPHDWHIIVRYDPSRSFKVNDSMQLQQRLSYTSLPWLPLIVGDFIVLDCCACIRYCWHRSTTKLHVLELVSIADTIVHMSVIATIKPMYTTVTTHAAFGFMLLAVAYCSGLCLLVMSTMGSVSCVAV